MRILVSLIGLMGVIASTGCQSKPIDTGALLEPNSSPAITSLPDALSQAISTPDKISTTMTKMPERVPPTEVTISINGEVPIKLLDAVLADLAKRIGVTSEKIAVIQSQATIWNDGSLGCARPGEFYTQAEVDGFWVILEIDGQQYDYRATDRGYFFLCERSFHPNPASSTPNS